MADDMLTRWFDQVWNKGRRDAIAELLAPNGLIYEGGLTILGPEGFYPFFDRMQSAFSDMHVTIDDTMSDGGKICARWTCTMRHTGDGLGMPATGRALRTTGITIVRVEGGRIVEGWQNWDMLALLERIQGVDKAPTYIGAS